MKIKIIEEKCEKREVPVFYRYLIRFKPKINLDRIAENNRNIEYDPELHREAKIKTKYGTILLWSSGAEVPRLKDQKHKAKIKKFIEDVCEEVTTSSYRSWWQEQKQDLKKELQGLI